MQNDFKQLLIAIANDAEKVYNNNDDLDAIYNKLNEELASYKAFIPNFFSYDNEAVRIKTLYKKLRELDYTRNRVIPCVNVSHAGYLYKEYFEGMYRFILKLCDEVRSIGENIHLMEQQLQTAIQGDPLFVDSIFGGKNNELRHDELTDAVQNVEYLVDFLDYVEPLHKMIDDIYNGLKKCSNYHGCTKAFTLVACSVSHFCYKILTAIIETYTMIYNALENKTEAPVDNSFKVF